MAWGKNLTKWTFIFIHSAKRVCTTYILVYCNVKRVQKGTFFGGWKRSFIFAKSISEIWLERRKTLVDWKRMFVDHIMLYTWGGNFWVVVEVKGCLWKLIWLLIDCTRVNNQSGARSVPWLNSWLWPPLKSIRPWVVVLKKNGLVWCFQYQCERSVGIFSGVEKRGGG